MSADYQDILAKLAIQANQQPQPSFAGISAPQDPAQIQNVLSKLRLQQYQDSAANLGATPGQYGYLHDQVTKGWQAQGYGMGQALQQATQGAPQQSPQGTALKQAILGAQAQYSQDLQSGVPPQQAKLNALTKMAQAGVPGVDTQIEAVQKDIENSKKTTAETYKDNQQGAASADEITNRAAQRDLENKKFAQSTAKDTWTKIAQDGGYITQVNGMGQIETKKNMDAATSQAASVTPTGMQSILDWYDQHDQLPANLPKGVAAKAWDAIGTRAAQTGNAEQLAMSNKYANTADAGALKDNAKQAQATNVYINTFDKNVAKVQQYAKDIDFGDVAKFNAAKAAWLKGTSDPAYQKYNVFFNAAASEFTKIQSGSLGNTPISDSARAHTDDVMSHVTGPDGINALLTAMREESQNKLSSLQEENANIMARIKARASGKPLPPTINVAPTTPAPQAAPAASGGWGTPSLVTQ